MIIFFMGLHKIIKIVFEEDTVMIKKTVAIQNNDHFLQLVRQFWSLIEVKFYFHDNWIV